MVDQEYAERQYGSQRRRLVGDLAPLPMPMLPQVLVR
jgi:hypothetical protein